METRESEYVKAKILDFLSETRQVDIETIIDFLDYINKVRYSEIEILKVLKDLEKEDKIISSNSLYSLM
jgi:hypothetical protein